MAKFPINCRWVLYLTLVLALIVPGILAKDTSCKASVEVSDNQGEISHQKYTIMRPTINETNGWIQSYKAAPDAYLSPRGQDKLKSTGGSHFTIVGHLNYTPSERDQGTCGNCWAWAGTGILEIALDTQLGIKDRLSVQYFNSNYNYGNGDDWSCCGGWLQDFAKFYNDRKMVVPWSNTDAQWQDGRMTCGTESSVPAKSISSDPHYDLESVQVVTIPTWGIEKEEAIANIKNVLDQEKGVWFGLFLPNQTAWNRFFDFWGYQPECAVWQPDIYTSQYSYSDGGGHAVLCVGYNDTDPKNRYWIMLNSWGVTKGRPDGFFMMNMDMNYSCEYSSLGNAFYWMTLDVNYTKRSPDEHLNRLELYHKGFKKLAPMPPLKISGPNEVSVKLKKLGSI